MARVTSSIRGVRDGVVGEFPRGAFDRHFLAAIEREVAVRPTCQSNRLLNEKRLADVDGPVTLAHWLSREPIPRLPARQGEADRSTELL